MSEFSSSVSIGDTVDHLVEDLNQIENAVVDRFIGQSKRGKREGMSQKQQLEQLERFRNGDINVLVATSVGEEDWMFQALPWSCFTSLFRVRFVRFSDGDVLHVRAAVLFMCSLQTTRDVHVLHASRNREQRMHNVLARMRLETPLGSYKIRKEGKLLDFEIVEGDQRQPALEFLEQEKTRLKSIELDAEQDKQANSENSSPSTSNNPPTLHTRPRSQKSLFDFEEDTSDPWKPVLDGRDINRQ